MIAHWLCLFGSFGFLIFPIIEAQYTSLEYPHGTNLFDKPNVKFINLNQSPQVFPNSPLSPLLLVYYRLRNRPTPQCVSDGIFSHHEDCRKFVRCQYSATDNVFYYRERTCPEGLAFDPELESCNYLSNVEKCARAFSVQNKYFPVYNSNTPNLSFNVDNSKVRFPYQPKKTPEEQVEDQEEIEQQQQQQDVMEPLYSTKSIITGPKKPSKDSTSKVKQSGVKNANKKPNGSKSTLKPPSKSVTTKPPSKSPPKRPVGSKTNQVNRKSPSRKTSTKKGQKVEAFTLPSEEQKSNLMLPTEMDQLDTNVDEGFEDSAETELVNSDMEDTTREYLIHGSHLEDADDI